MTSRLHHLPHWDAALTSLIRDFSSRTNERSGGAQLATALDIQAVAHHCKKVRFFATVDLINALEQEKAMNKAGQLADRLSKLDLVILDELG